MYKKRVKLSGHQFRIKRRKIDQMVEEKTDEIKALIFEN
jgi:hypothetical protein